MEQKTTSHLNEKIRSYTLEFKLTAIDFAEVLGNRASANKFNVDVKRIREWRKSKEAIAEKKTSTTGKNQKRLSGGCKPKDVGSEEELMEWITQRRTAKLRVLRKLIMFKARRLHEERVGEDAADKNVFVASRGWLMNEAIWIISKTKNYYNSKRP